MANNIHVPSTPRHLKVTQTMQEDFLRDPVLASRVLLSITFDAFQAAAMRICWLIPSVIDESGFGTGKSLRLWALAQLRCMLMVDQWCYAYYQRFQSGKDIFWANYESKFASNPYFRAQLGKLDQEGDTSGKDNTRGPACYIQHFKNGGRCMMGAPGWLQNAISQAGITLSWALIDEWTKIEAMGKKTGVGAIANSAGGMTGGIDQQVLGRLRRSNFNQFHPLWANHVLLSATAESESHPSQRRVNQFRREIAKGNPNYAIISFSFKDASNLKSHTGKPFRDQIIDWSAIQRMKAMFTPSHFKRECLGIRGKESAGWYSEENLARCAAVGAANGLEPELARGKIELVRHVPPGAKPLMPGADGVLTSNPFATYALYFMGVDPAPARGAKSDDGALAILRVRPRPGLRELTANESDWLAEYVWAYRLRGATARQWSGFIHQRHRLFGFVGILMDAQGGGQWINDELILRRQLIDGAEQAVIPIASQEDLERTGPNVQLVLSMYRRRDPGIQFMWPSLQGDDNLYEAMHNVYQEAVVYQKVSFPKPYNERPGAQTADWPDEKKWALKTLDAARRQLQEIQVEVTEDGTFALTGHSAKRFHAAGKKDLAYACIYAYIRFRIWLLMGGPEFTDGLESGSDGMCHVMS